LTAREVDQVVQRRSAQTKRSELVALPESDEALASRARDDAAALTEIYLRYAGPVFGYFRLRTGNAHVAEDLTSQTFTQMLEALPRFRAERFRAWLFVIAHNVLVDSQRRRRPILPLDDVSYLSDGHDPEAIVLDSLAGDDLRSALLQLSTDQCAVIDLRLSGLTGAEIASALGKSLPWVYTTQHRALQRLRALMAKDLKVTMQ
jgi:RNA polymerase sigma-70 factor (ECF subfamily)